MDEEYMSYTVFTVKDRNGNDVEMAVMEEFEVDGKTYVAGARIEGDSISEEGVYLYRARMENDEIIAEKITDETEYKKVTEAYVSL